MLGSTFFDRSHSATKLGDTTFQEALATQSNASLKNKESCKSGLSILLAASLFALPVSGHAQSVTPTPDDGQVGTPVELVTTLNNTVQDVTVSGLPTDAVLSAGTQDPGDPTVWVVPAAAFSAGSPVTFTSNTRGTYSITFSQDTDGNQFSAFDNGTFGSGAATRGPDIGATSFTYDPAGNIGPGSYSVIKSTDDPERATAARESQCDGVYISLDDQDDPGNGYFLFYDAQSAATDPNQVFLNQALSGLIPGAEYTFSYDAGNVYTGFNRFCRRNPDNVFPAFSVRLSGDAATQPTAADEVSNTGLLAGQTPWTNFSSTFTAGATQTDGVIAVVMTGTGGVIGADVIFDNFTLSATVTGSASYTVFEPELQITKIADDDELVTVGQEITYTYTVTNTGDVNINNVTINDVHNGAGPAPVPGDEQLLTDNGTTGDSTDAAQNGSWDVLAPGDTVTFTGTYTVQQADIDNLQ